MIAINKTLNKSFPTLKNSAADHFENIFFKVLKTSVNENTMIE